MRDTPELVWEAYQSLEDEFLNYLKYVPLTPNHYKVWSFQLANLLNNTGSSVDSFFKNAILCPSLDNYDDINTIRANVRQHNMTTYRKIFNSRYHLSDKNIFEMKTFTTICPYYNWNNNSPLQWWSDYTSIKHNRFLHNEKATLKSTLEALGGLFILFLYQKETIPVLVDRNIINSGGLRKDIVKEKLLRGEPTGLGAIIYAKTPLFGYVFEYGLPINENDRKKILSPESDGRLL
jgi:hypothetical protein